MQKYSQLIESLRPLLPEAATLFDSKALHENPRFRKWRLRVTDLVKRIKAEGYSVNCSIADRRFDKHSSYGCAPLDRDRLASFNRDLQDTINELQLIIENHDQFGANMNPARSKKQDTRAGLVEKLKQHWLIATLGLCGAVAGATWTTAIQLLVSPRDFEIARLERALDAANKSSPSVSATNASIVLSDGVFEGASATTSDGSCNVHIKNIVEGRVSLVVSIKAEQPQQFEKVEVGRRISLMAGGAAYFLDIHRVRGNIVDLTVTRQM